VVGRTAPIEHEARALDDDAAVRMAAEVRASALRATSASLDQLAASLPEPVVSISLRAWPPSFPDDIAVQRRPPYESQAEKSEVPIRQGELVETEGLACCVMVCRIGWLAIACGPG
jgi:hypothetical protein